MTALNSLQNDLHDQRVTEEGIRQAYRSLELLETLRLVNRTDAVTIRLTEAGESAFNNPVQLELVMNDYKSDIASFVESLAIEDSVISARVSSNVTVTQVDVKNWRQFEEASIELHPRLTILTGANASGKTTLLNLLAPHFSWSAQLVSKRKKHADGVPLFPEPFGTIRYSNGATSPIANTPVYGSDGVGYENSPVFIPFMQAVPGIFISSHRSISSYRPLDQIPARFSQAQVLLQQFSSEVQNRYIGASTSYSPFYRMKEALVGAAIYGYGNAALEPDPDALEIWQGFEAVLRTFLPRSLAFKELRVREADIILGTHSGEFPLEAVSGGVSAMIELAWQIFLRAKDSDAFTVCIDEPENHLHPELQRRIIPSLIEAFPNVTFVVATHSPSVVTSVRDCTIYSLRKLANGKVRSKKLINPNPSATPDDTLMSVLDLDSPLGLWAEHELESALRGISADPTVEELRNLRRHLKELGLERQFPAAVNSLSDKSLND